MDPVLIFLQCRLIEVVMVNTEIIGFFPHLRHIKYTCFYILTQSRILYVSRFFLEMDTLLIHHCLPMYKRLTRAATKVTSGGLT